MAGKVDKHLVYHQLMDSLEQDACPICALIDKDKFRRSGFLCRPHLLKVLDIAKDESCESCLKEMLDIHMDKLRSLAHDLGEIQRKSDYRLRKKHPQTAAKSGVWLSKVVK